MDTDEIITTLTLMGWQPRQVLMHGVLHVAVVRDRRALVCLTFGTVQDSVLQEGSVCLPATWSNIRHTQLRGLFSAMQSSEKHHDPR